MDMLFSIAEDLKKYGDDFLVELSGLQRNLGEGVSADGDRAVHVSAGSGTGKAVLSDGCDLRNIK